MIVSFYDKNFKGLQQNASLTVDKQSYSLVKRPVDINTLSCKCEAFTEDIQPTFLIIKDDRGGYIYGSLAGIPVLNSQNITEVTGTDLKTMLSSDVLLTPGSYPTVNSYIIYVFEQWKSQVNKGTIPVELVFKDYIGTDTNTPMGDYKPATDTAVYNAWEEIQSYLKYYNLYMETFIDLINKKVQFIIGRTMYRQLNIKLWEYGIKNYSKWIASVNETVGYYVNEDSNYWQVGSTWILTSGNNITTDSAKRDIYPVKRKIFTSTKSLREAETQALSELLDAMYNEELTLPTTDINPDFETKFSIYLKRGADKYKDLPCGELHYDASGLIKCQIGYRFTGAEFI